MNVLAIECSTSVLSIGLKKGDSLFTYSQDHGLKHSERLMPFVIRLLTDADMEVDDLDAVACGLGPGSFTGLRIAMSTAKGLAKGAGIPFFAIPTLDLYVRDYSFFEGVVVPVIDAKKKKFYTALYKDGKRLTDFLDITPGKLLEYLEPYERVLFTGPDCSRFYSIIQKGVYFDKSPRAGKALQLLSLTLDKLEENPSGDSMDLGPLYIRKSEAEENRRLEK